MSRISPHNNLRSKTDHMTLLVIFYSWYAKLLIQLVRLTGSGSGTSIGGWFGEKYLPFIVSYYNRRYKKIVFISGTNGKTTTRSLINHFLTSGGRTVCSNLGGANIYRGIVTSLLNDTKLFGGVRSRYLVLEVEEATLPRLSKYLRPDILVLTNIFRDQLDAYGEIDTTLKYFKTAISQTEPIVVVNADDDKLVSTLESLPVQEVFGFSVIDKEKIKFEPHDEHPKVTYAEIISIQTTQGNLVSIQSNTDLHMLSTSCTQLPGTYNLYNIVAAATTVNRLLDGWEFFDALKTYKPAFGRGESIQYNNRTIELFLVKNPAGYDSVLHHITKTYDQASTSIVFALNDKIADGKDVSWIWDVDFENFHANFEPKNIYTYGTRTYDMLLRLNVAGYSVVTADARQTIKELFADNRTKNETIVIMATYTALLDIRKKLGEIIPGFVSNISKQGN